MSTQSVQVGTGVIVVREGKILLAKRKGSHGAGMWGGAGGHVEFGEKPSDAVKREAMEELGITLKKVKFLCVSDFHIDGKHYIDIGFTADIKSGEPIIQPAEKHKIAEVKWFSLKDLPTPIFQPVLNYLDALQTGCTYFEQKRVTGKS